MYPLASGYHPATAAILDLVSVDYLTNACRLLRFFGASLGVINVHHVPMLLPKPSCISKYR
jgi:hypothetical protein